MAENKVVEFKFIPIRELYSSDNYKIYSVDVDRSNFPDLKSNNRGEFTAVGDIPTLMLNNEYSCNAIIEINKNYGVQYKITNVRKEKPTDIESSRKFLLELITERQTENILKVYPDIIDRVIKNKEIDVEKLYGIGDFTLNKIKKTIIENFSLIDLVDKFSGLLSFNVIKKLYDRYSSIELVEEKLKEDPYKCLCSLSRIGFKTADKIIIDVEEFFKNKNEEFFYDKNIKKSPIRLIRCMMFMLEQNQESGCTRMLVKDLRSKCNEIVPEAINYFLDILKADKEIFHLDKATKTVALFNTYKTECEISYILKEMVKINNSFGINTELYREFNGITLTDEQMVALDNGNDYNVSILTAGAGMGKSQTMSNYIYMLEDNNKSYMMCTPTGKSSEVLAKYTGREVGTIHRQLGFHPEEGWCYNKENKLEVDVVVIDEFGMTDIWLFLAVLYAIDINKTKLVLVFDSYQLASVGAGNLAHDLLMSGIIPTAILTKVFRYGEGGQMQIATKVRNSEEFLPSKFTGREIFGINKDFIYMEMQQTKMLAQVKQIYLKLIKDGYSLDDIMVLTSQNKGDLGTRAVNKFIQDFIQRDKDNPYLIKGENKFYKDDKVVQIRNNYNAEATFGFEVEGVAVYNGNTGVVSSVDNHSQSMIVDFGNGKLIRYDKAALDQLELGYCTTIHKSQGSSSKQVICVTPKAHTYMLNSNLLYVALTRASERVWMIGNIITINRAIKKKENFNRDTWTKDLLK